MLKLRYLFRLTVAFLKRFKGLILLGGVLGLAFFVSTNFLFPIFFGKSVERIGITGRYRVKDIPETVLVDVSQGLTKVNSQGLSEPDLAKSWEVKDDGKTWIFRLNDNLFWQDGKPLKAGEINLELESVAIEKPDDTTIIFKLKDPFSPFPNVVSQPVFKKGLLGTGKWKVTKLSLVSGLVEKIVLQDSDRNRKIYKFYPTEERTKLAFKLGEVDFVYDIIDPKPISSWDNTKTKANVNSQRFVAVFFATQDPLLSSKELRQGLSYAINKEQFEGPRSFSPISPNSWGYNPQVKTYNYDPDRARELIDKLPDETKKSLTVKLTTTSTLLTLAERIVKDWSEAGIKASVLVTPTIPSEYQAFLAIYDIPADPDQYATWHSSQKTTNIAGYSSPRIDKLLEDGRTTVDQGERKKIYMDFQRYLLEDAPAAFLYHPISYTISRK